MPAKFNMMYLVLAAIGAQTALSQQLPDRPAAVVTQYKETWRPVVSADGNSPVIIVNENRITLSSGADVMLTLSDHYGSGFVTISDAYTSDFAVTNDPDTAATQPNEMAATSEVLRANLQADADISNAYVLLIRYSPNQRQDSQPSLAVVLHSVGNITSATQTSLYVVLPKFGHDAELEWSILVFADGRQIRSTGMGKVLPGYFDRVETRALQKRIAERAIQGTNAPASAPIAVFRKMPLNLPSSITSAYLGTIVKVELRVGADGHVFGVKPLGVSNAALWDALNRGFADWLFLPQMKDGVAVPGSVVIPLQL